MGNKRHTLQFQPKKHYSQFQLTTIKLWIVLFMVEILSMPCVAHELVSPVIQHWQASLWRVPKPCCQTSQTRLASLAWAWHVKTLWRPQALTTSWHSLTPLLRLTYRSSLASCLESKKQGHRAPVRITGLTDIWATQGIINILSHKNHYSQFEWTMLKFPIKIQWPVIQPWI